MTDKISELKIKLESNPNQVFHRYSLGQAYLDIAELSSACEEFEKCLIAKPDWMMAALSLGKTYLQVGDKALAKEKLELTLKLATEQNHDDPASEATELLKECNIS
jgi:cytochrome c-type biogenesis protein CcmH/NrfG